MKLNIVIIASLLVFTSCKHDTKNVQANEDITAEMTNTKIKNTIVETDRTSMTKGLIGTWECTSPPYAKILVEAERIKFISGEPNAEPATFQAYTITTGCPNLSEEDKAKIANANLTYIVATDDSRCESFVLKGDSLTIGGPTGSYEIVYKRK